MTMELIDKSAVVAEIERRRRDWWFGSSTEAKFKREECDDILSLLDTLKVKEVDLDMEVALWANAIPEIRLDDVERLAKYFYELGLKAQRE